jgi:hypothetical protein
MAAAVSRSIGGDELLQRLRNPRMVLALVGPFQDHTGVDHSQTVLTGDDRVQIHLVDLGIGLYELGDGHEEVDQGFMVNGRLPSNAIQNGSRPELG